MLIRWGGRKIRGTQGSKGGRLGTQRVSAHKHTHDHIFDSLRSPFSCAKASRQRRIRIRDSNGFKNGS